MSLWTPSGEHPVGERRPTQGPDGPLGRRPAGPAGPGAPPAHAGGREAGAGAGPAIEPPDVDELRRQLADAPADVVVANHCYGLFELAAVHLSQSPPRLAQARLAIDAFGLLVDGLGDRLGPAGAELRDALAQVRLAFVQIQAAAPPPAPDGAATPGGAPQAG